MYGTAAPEWCKRTTVRERGSILELLRKDDRSDGRLEADLALASGGGSGHGHHDWLVRCGGMGEITGTPGSNSKLQVSNDKSRWALTDTYYAFREERLQVDPLVRWVETCMR